MASSSSVPANTGVQSIRKASAPFDKPTANVILRSSDRVDFYVRKAILEEASPVFEGMFSLPPMPEDRKRKERDEEEYVDDIPVVNLAEDGQAVDMLLRFCYPMKNPSFTEDAEAAGLICKVIAAARKYQMDSIEEALSPIFDEHAKKEPVRMYLHAAHRHWEAEMKIAAKATIPHPLPFSCADPMIDHVSAGSYLRLHTYHKRCCVAAAKSFEKVISSTGRYWYWGWLHPNLRERVPAWQRCTLAGHPVQFASVAEKDYVAYSNTAGETVAQHEVKIWFAQFVKSLATHFTSCVRTSMIIETEIDHLQMERELGSCPRCRANVKSDLEQVRKGLVAQVQRDIDAVSSPFIYKANSVFIFIQIQLEIKV